jgi:hypothetical protein
MRHLLVPALCSLAAVLAAADAPATATAPALQPEPARIGDSPVQVSPKKEIQFPVKADPDVEYRELWFQSFDGIRWGVWQKLGQSFSKDAPVVWAPPEGHWKVYIRKTLTSKLAGPDPSKEPEKIKAQAEFIIDRTAPKVDIAFPANKAKLRGGDKYTVTWKAEDAYLRNAPIFIRWSRDGATFETVGEALPNSGAFEWTVPRDMTTSGVLRIEAADKATNVGIAEVTGLIVDSVKPKGAVTGPTITARADVELATEVADLGPAGLTAARLWVSQDDGVSWTEGPFIAEPFKSVQWKAPADGRFRLYIVATDGAGNVSPAPKGKEGNVLTVDATVPTVLLAAATGVSDAAGAAGRRDFKPGDRVQVVFTTKDANLVADSVAVYWQKDAGSAWQELGKGQKVDAAFRFTIPTDAPATKTARVKVTAADAAGNVGEAVSTETFTVQTQVVDDTLEAPLQLNP